MFRYSEYSIIWFVLEQNIRLQWHRSPQSLQTKKQFSHLRLGWGVSNVGSFSSLPASLSLCLSLPLSISPSLSLSSLPSTHFHLCLNCSLFDFWGLGSWESRAPRNLLHRQGSPKGAKRRLSCSWGGCGQPLTSRPAALLVREEAGWWNTVIRAKVCPAGVTKDSALTTPLGLRLRNGHVMINEASFQICLERRYKRRLKLNWKQTDSGSFSPRCLSPFRSHHSKYQKSWRGTSPGTWTMVQERENAHGKPKRVQTSIPVPVR